MKKGEFVKQIQQDLINRTRHTKLTVEKLALSFGISDKNLVKELTELAIVNVARIIAHKKLPVYDRFCEIVHLYHSQVNLSHRTSKSMLLQQYSTPAPIGFLMGIFCKLDELWNSWGKKTAFEPSAGNGLLTIAGEPQHIEVNEIDQVRRDNLKTQGFKFVYGFDASIAPESNFTKKYYAVISNPPFGAMDAPIKFDGFPISVLDHLMVIYALETMRDIGRAAFIIGGHTTWDEQGRIQAGKNRTFFAYLYKNYNVLDVINIDGHKLYSRQGTAFNTRLILIDGRKNNPSGYPPLYNPDHDKICFDFTDLYNRVNKFIDRAQSETSVPAMDKNIEMEAAALELELELMKL